MHNIEGESRPLGVLRFFETSDVGFEVRQRGAAWTITKVMQGEPFERCGFRVGDQIVSVNGTAIDSLHTLRRLLRRHHVEKSIVPAPLPIVIERAGKKLELKLAYK